MRKSTTVVYSSVRGIDAFHFTGRPLRSLDGSYDNVIWFPVPKGKNLIQAVEEVMVLNGIARELVSFDAAKMRDDSIRYTVTYSELN